MVKQVEGQAESQHAQHQQAHVHLKTAEDQHDDTRLKIAHQTSKGLEMSHSTLFMLLSTRAGLKAIFLGLGHLWVLMNKPPNVCSHQNMFKN